jgi:hypothetical protein
MFMPKCNEYRFGFKSLNRHTHPAWWCEKPKSFTSGKESVLTMLTKLLRECWLSRNMEIARHISGALTSQWEQIVAAC